MQEKLTVTRERLLVYYAQVVGGRDRVVGVRISDFMGK